MFKNALISTSNKNGLVEFLKPLVARGLRVVSTGGTSKYLRENGIAVVEVAEQTGFPEVMDGRVRTLHPRIHIPLLARENEAEDQALLKSEGLDPFDLVIVNLYPFEDALKKGVQGDELIEFIDIGGPSLLRAAAKNFGRLAVVCDPADYSWIAQKASGGGLSVEDRRKLAAKVFSHTAHYDALIAQTLDPENLADRMLAGRVVQELRYGENPQQKAWWMENPGAAGGLQAAEILHGKPLSYNNLLDLDAAISALQEFSRPAAVAVKHTNPCGVGTAETIAQAVQRSLNADPVSVFGGIVAINRPVDSFAAEDLSKIFLECIAAPDFSSDALDKLKRKKDLRLLKLDLKKTAEPVSFRTIQGGYLLQSKDQVNEDFGNWQIIGESPSPEIRADLMMAWKVCAHLKSNAIAIAAAGETLGLGMGQVNRVDAVEQAIARMHKHHPGRKNAVLASDAFFPFPDSIELIANAGIRWVIQPGGSIRDELVISRAKELHVNMVLTKMRHFRH
jgi:phosphoribosylaminoimidazolecarboxamide formyltransferase/IMP cyclohydrolase